MSNSYFQFKQFAIRQDKCAMKVGTDSLLLGAWVNASDCLRILDIGTGTGILAMMLAQRTVGAIDAIEIDEDAYNQAVENINNCKWKDRISLYNQSYQDFSQNCTVKYDLIISNPPYFDSSIKAPELKRAIARHSHLLPLDVFTTISKKLLTEHGRIAIILPFENRIGFIKQISKNDLWVLRELTIQSVLAKTPIRVAFEITKHIPDKIDIQKIVIREHQNYSKDYINLTKDFYLNLK